MKDLSIQAKFYLTLTYIVGAFFLLHGLLVLQLSEPWMLLALSVLASLALILKVEGATDRSHYTINLLVYGFSFAYLGVPGALIVIIISNLAEWLWNRPPWYIQAFNTSCYIIVMQIAGITFLRINPSGSITSGLGILAIAASMEIFTILNHFMVGIIIWLARGENFKQSGVFDLLPLIIDLTLLSFGAVLVVVWDYNPYAIALFLLPLYLIYDTLRVPALERQTETDDKTGLYNHAYFMSHLNQELDRANRFNRPLAVIIADLDLLRNINNTYGHLAGDEVLIGIARILKNVAHDFDVVARFGGEEFTILLPETPLTQAYARAEAIRKAIENAEFTIPTSVTPLKVTISTGVSSREEAIQTAEELIHNADTALYHAKLKGRNQTFAYTDDAYVNFITDQKVMPSESAAAQQELHPVDGANQQDQSRYRAAQSHIVKKLKPASQSMGDPATPKIGSNVKKDTLNAQFKVNVYITGIVLSAVGLLAVGYSIAPHLYKISSQSDWIGLAGCALLILLTEWLSIDLYIRNTSLSTSAVPILAGTLLYGPPAAVLLGSTYALVTGIKHRSHFNRYLFNASNQVIAGMLYTIPIILSGQLYTQWHPMLQLMVAILSAMVVYLSNTWLIAIGMGLDMGRSIKKLWSDQYGWMVTIYLGMGLVAYAFGYGYFYDKTMGLLLLAVPLLLLRVSQMQYIERTRGAVSELREKNVRLKKNAAEINELNQSLLDTLAEVIEMRDPYVLGHSRHVTDVAIKIGQVLGLNHKQLELVRKASLLHDIGKLGIPVEILSKPSPLTDEEFETIKHHPDLGASLLEKSPALRQLVPIVRHHHEFYNGKGYPQGLNGESLPIETRIVSVADAIEAMSSDRPYRKAIGREKIISELIKFSGIQFDPQVVAAALQILEEDSASPVNPAGLDENSRCVPVLNAVPGD